MWLTGQALAMRDLAEPLARISISLTKPHQMSRRLNLLPVMWQLNQACLIGPDSGGYFAGRYKYGSAPYHHNANQAPYQRQNNGASQYGVVFQARLSVWLWQASWQSNHAQAFY